MIKKILFVDFNGVLSYNPFWSSLRDPIHPLNRFYEPIEALLFNGDNQIKGLVDAWMIGQYTSEEVHRIIAERTGAPYQSLFEIFCQDCRQIDISMPIIEKIKDLRKSWYCILRTDNMDSLHRFTIPANPCLTEAFNDIQSSFLIGQLKKSNHGSFFLTTISGLNSKIENCVLVDDSRSTCTLFESLGGHSFCTSNEHEVLAVLNKLNR